MHKLRALAFNLFYFGWTALLAIFGLPTLLVGHRAVYGLCRIWVGGILGALKLLIGLDHRIEGAAHRPTGAAIYAAKHQSAWETLAFALLLDRPIYVLKRELTWIPVFGWYLMRSGAIAIDRKAGMSALKKLVHEGKRAQREGRPILIFPEGTRAAPGARLPYQPGVAALYDQLDLPVVPVALNSGLYWGRRSFTKRAGLITVAFLEPIPPGLKRRDFMARLEQEIESASARLIAKS